MIRPTATAPATTDDLYRPLMTCGRNVKRTKQLFALALLMVATFTTVALVAVQYPHLLKDISKENLLYQISIGERFNGTHRALLLRGRAAAAGRRRPLWKIFPPTPLLLNPEALECVGDHPPVCNVRDKREPLLLGYFNPETFQALASRRYRLGHWRVTGNWSDAVCLSAGDGASPVCVTLLEQRDDYWMALEVTDGQSPRRSSMAFPNTDVRIWRLDDAAVAAPFPVTAFLGHRSRSRFLQCDAAEAARVKQKFGHLFVGQPVISDGLVDDLVEFRDLLWRFGVWPMLCCGTLLGWYRECGILTHTTDVDLCFPVEQWTDHAEAAIRAQTFLKLDFALGYSNQLIQIRVRINDTPIDLFGWQPDKNGGLWAGVVDLVSRKKFKLVYKGLTSVCAADLKGRLFHVPCNVEQFITEEYGKNWRTPVHSSKFFYSKSSKNIRPDGAYSVQEWRDMYRTNTTNAPVAAPGSATTRV